MTTAPPAPRVAIVTGAGRGIGAAIATRLAADGFAVGVLDLTQDSCADTVQAITGSGGTAVAVGADVSSAPDAAAAVETVASALGRPTVLVNNAGITRDNLLFKMTEDDWDSVINVHLRGTFLMSRAVQKHMLAAKWGRIVNLSSTSALGQRGQANYAAAKAGLQGLTKTLAIELGRFGVTVNAVAPGFIQTEMTRATANASRPVFRRIQCRTSRGYPGPPSRPAAGCGRPGLVLRPRRGVIRVRAGRVCRRGPEGMSDPLTADTVRAGRGSPPGLDVGALAGFLEAARPGLIRRPLAAALITGGSSNLTYDIRDADGRELIVRRPPLGHVLATAHDMGREYRVITALEGSAVPVPHAHVLCGDPEVIGAPFFVMDKVAGVALRQRAELELLGTRAGAADLRADDRRAGRPARDRPRCRPGWRALAGPPGTCAAR